MKHFFPLLTGLFSFILIDLKRFRARRATLSFCAQGQVLEEELTKRARYQRKISAIKEGTKILNTKKGLFIDLNTPINLEAQGQKTGATRTKEA